MNPASAQPEAFVEAARRRPRHNELTNGLDDAALRRCTSFRHAQQDRLANRRLSIAHDERRCADVIASATVSAGDDEPRARGRTHASVERAHVERVQAHAPPPPAGEYECERERSESRVTFYGQ